MSELPPPPAPPEMWRIEVRDLTGERIVTIYDVVSYELAGSVWFIEQDDGALVTLPLDAVISVRTPSEGPA